MSLPRIVHLTTVHHPLDPRIFWKQASSLRRAGYEVFLVARHHRRENREGIEVVPLPEVQGRYRRVLLQRRAFREARALDAAVYHFHDPELIPVAYALKRATGARVIYDIHEDYRWHGRLEGRLLRTLERWCFTWVDHVVVVDPQLEAWAKSHKMPTTLIANYFLPPSLHPTTPDHTSRSLDEPFRLLYTGYSAHQRGLPTLIGIAEAIVEEGLDWHLNLVGRCTIGRDRKAAEAHLRTSPGDRVLSRTGWDTFVPAAAMVPFYQQAHVGLVLWYPHPNHSRIPTKFYEYLHWGLPILCSDFPLWRTFIETHRCGAVVDPHDVSAAMQVLETWAHDAGLYARLSEAATHASRLYQWSVMETRLLALYSDLLSE